jgi:sporulation protein YlmC with PRC-barrel domain
MKQLLISTAVSALMISGAISGAMAQTMQDQRGPAATTQAPTTQASPTTSAKFLTAQSPDQWVFSKFKGTDVLGANDEHIGDVNDIVFDKTGKVQGVVVGVGGFLGIGEKNVAIDLSAFQVVPANSNASSNSANANDPNNVKLKVAWTKDELKNAPAFQYWNASSSASPTTGQAPRDRGSAPATAPGTTPAPSNR